MNTPLTNTKKPDSVQIVSIKRMPGEPVYNMEVDGNHNFAVNGGIIVHNCMDSTRYFCRTMGLAKLKRGR